MKAQTRLFGEIDIGEDKIITFKDGMIGLPEYKRYTLIYDLDKKDTGMIKWLQSLDDKDVAFPVIDPSLVIKGYEPFLDLDILSDDEDVKADNIIVLVTLTAPKDITKLSVNLRAPIFINSSTLNAAQCIQNDNSFPIKYYIYDIIKPESKTE
ncbi:flagellar assembly factor FliW [Acetitomaculum ruminis DSM 5522]|uniref:Flagellar assembly factor FliW n=1 Tax=Acetitomaculum ruminis DSM 5522 TaxID=1120918 RepID=A0A1I0WKI8_9FIRM|nr:flagellar assembly protein FliW [Acetitomaculum ruminis]SFA88738.1 flagellar assembly factor FliW [Acetitomaculum ruminis DSM 5522]